MTQQIIFYCATIAYHVELNAISGDHRHPANIQEKWTHNIGEMPSNRGDPLLPVSRWPQYGIRAFLLEGKRSNFIWIYVSLDTETSSVSLFYNIESYFVTIHRTD